MNQHISISDKLCKLLNVNTYDHFRDITKMVINIDSLRFTRFDSPIDCYLKILPSCISQEWLKIPGEPYFYFLFTAIAFNVRSYRVK